MQLLIKQKVFSWTDTYDVYDTYGSPRYFVKAEFLTLGHQIHIYDKRTGAEVGSIHQKLLTLLPTFEIVMGGQVVGTIRREFTFFKPRYTADFRDWTVEGDFWDWNYSVWQGQRQVMSIQRQWLTWGDTYVLEYSDYRDELPGLLLVIAIDAANCGND